MDALISAAGSKEPHPCDARFAFTVTQILSTAETLLHSGTH